VEFRGFSVLVSGNCTTRPSRARILPCGASEDSESVLLNDFAMKERKLENLGDSPFLKVESEDLPIDTTIWDDRKRKRLLLLEVRFQEQLTSRNDGRAHDI